jgi:hypothetical protein
VAHGHPAKSNLIQPKSVKPSLRDADGAARGGKPWFRPNSFPKQPAKKIIISGKMNLRPKESTCTREGAFCPLMRRFHGFLGFC